MRSKPPLLLVRLFLALASCDAAPSPAAPPNTKTESAGTRSRFAAGDCCANPESAAAGDVGEGIWYVARLEGDSYILMAWLGRGWGNPVKLERESIDESNARVPCPEIRPPP